MMTRQIVKPPAGYQPTALRPASTLMMVRERGSNLEAFLQLRHEKMDFVPSVLVFPGGKLDEDDKSSSMLSRLWGVDRSAEEAGLFVSAIRETFEECGVLFARRAGHADLINGDDDAGLLAQRESVNSGRLSFGEFIARENLVLAGDLIKPFARWATPWWHKKRYDTHFFVARAPDGQTPYHDGNEAVESIWMVPTAAGIAEAFTQRKMLPPTVRCLERVRSAAGIDQLLSTDPKQAFNLVEHWLERRPQGFVFCQEPVRDDEPLELPIGRLAQLGIEKDLAAAIQAELAAKGWPD